MYLRTSHTLTVFGHEGPTTYNPQPSMETIMGFLDREDHKEARLAVIDVVTRDGGHKIINRVTYVLNREDGEWVLFHSC